MRNLRIGTGLALVAVFAVIGFVSTPNIVKAIGVGPGTIVVEAVHRDIGVSQHVRVSRQPEDVGDMSMGVEFLADYPHHFSGHDVLVLPANEESAIYDFDIKPTDAAAGDYNGLVVFYVYPDSEAGGSGGAGLSIVKGTASSVYYTVTGEEIIGYEAVGIGVNSTEVGQPLDFSYTMNNTGSVEWRPDQVELVFTNKKDSNDITTIDLDKEDIVLVPPGQTQVNNVAVDHSLSEASYDLQVNFYYNNEKFADIGGYFVSVYAAGTLDQACELLSLSTNKDSYQLGEKIKLDAVIQNTGDLSSEASLYTEIYFGDELLDMIKGEELSVAPKEELTLSEIIDLDQIGQYSLKSYVQYGNKKTSTETVEFSVVESVVAVSWLNSTVGLIALVVVIVFIAILIKLKRRKGIKQPPTPPAATQPPQSVQPPAAPPAPPAPAVKSPQSPKPPTPPVAHQPAPSTPPKPPQPPVPSGQTQPPAAPSQPVDSQKEQ